MSEQHSTAKTNGRLPTHVAYQVREREGKNAIWTRVGSAWSHADNKGFSIQLDAVPLDGRVTLRTPDAKQD